MFRSSSPFSSLSAGKKPVGAKQHTLSLFLVNKDAKKRQEQAESPFAHVHKKKAAPEVIDLDEESDKENSVEPEPVPAGKLSSFSSTQEHFSQSGQRLPASKHKAANFKHSKPLSRHLSFKGHERKRKHGSSSSQPASKRRTLPWLPSGSLSNPRKKGLPARDTGRDSQRGMSAEQQRVLEAVMYERKNVFFTGAAGTGKSFLLRLLIRQLRGRYGKEAVQVTASTGMAATNIGGITINKFAGIGYGTGGISKLVGWIKKSREKHARWLQTKFLVIDEVSMVSAALFTKLNEVAKQVRNSSEPFGGIQLVLTGDFFQLPPVGRSAEDAKFCFDSDAWRQCIKNTYLLTEVYRQKGDSELVEMLNALRVGEISPEIRDKFRKLSRHIEYTDGILPTELYPTRAEVAASNAKRLADLPGEEVVYPAEDFRYMQKGGGTMPATEMDSRTLDGLMCTRDLRLKEGAQVINLRNDPDDDNMVNGTVGKVVCFTTNQMYNWYEGETSGYEQLECLPLLTYASRLIGHTDARVDDQLFAEMAAGSSACMNRKLDLLPRLVSMARSDTQNMRYPLVKFTTNSEKGYRLKVVSQESFSPADNALLKRNQLPIILSWALSIHKSQGQTLSRVKVDLTKVFEKGQVYVALSRCTSIDGLEVINFDARKVAVRPEVALFYKQLERTRQKDYGENII